jgi:hypothetical protein
MANLIIITAVLTGLITIYIFVIRPWHLRWGANSQETNLNLPGDELVEKPDFLIVPA